MRQKRLQAEFKEMMADPPANCSAGPKNESNLDLWEATIFGASGTVYEGGVFKLDINFPQEYPFKAPVVKFQTKIIHPNISKDNGSICLDILKQNYSPAISISKLLLSIVSLLSDPNPKDPLEPEIAHLYETNRLEYEIFVKKWVVQYASF